MNIENLPDDILRSIFVILDDINHQFKFKEYVILKLS